MREMDIQCSTPLKCKSTSLRKEKETPCLSTGDAFSANGVLLIWLCFSLITRLSIPCPSPWYDGISRTTSSITGRTVQVCLRRKLRVRFFGSIRKRICDLRSFRSWRIKGSGESSSRVDSSDPLMRHDPNEL